MNWVRLLTRQWIADNHDEEARHGYHWKDPWSEDHTLDYEDELPYLVDQAEADKPFIPVPVHLIGYNFCGPGTRDFSRKPVNHIDNICRIHDLMYADESISTEVADKVMIYNLWQTPGITAAFLKNIFQTKVWFDTQFPNLSDRIFRPSAGASHQFEPNTARPQEGEACFEIGPGVGEVSPIGTWCEKALSSAWIYWDPMLNPTGPHRDIDPDDLVVIPSQRKEKRSWYISRQGRKLSQLNQEIRFIPPPELKSGRW